ncbi:MAG: SPW repeat protein [Pseudomonadota bacterium]
MIGIWLVVSRWVLGFSSDPVTTWNAPIIGLLVLCVAGWELYALPAEARMQH